MPASTKRAASMDFQFTAHEEQFRLEVEQFLRSRMPADWDTRSFALPHDAEERRALASELRRALGEQRWLAIGWPEEWGGQDAGQMRQMLLNEQLAYLDSPGDGGQGVNWVGPALMLFGNDEQRRLYLPRIASGDDTWATLYTEPGAGSDLASVQTSAVRDGDDFIINGHKVWIADADQASYGWLAARTDPGAPKHRGLSTFVLPMDARGVEVRPLETMAGDRNLHEVFLNNVRIPAANLVGTEHRGWHQMVRTLDAERSGVATFARGRRNIEHLVRLAKDDPRLIEQNPGMRYELADRWIELQVGLNVAYRIPWLQEQGLTPNHESSVSKLYGSELNQRVAATGIELLGLTGQLREGAPLAGFLSRAYLQSVGATIAGGTSEVQRNIIAQRGLGLPRA